MNRGSKTPTATSATIEVWTDLVEDTRLAEVVGAKLREVEQAGGEYLGMSLSPAGWVQRHLYVVVVYRAPA